MDAHRAVEILKRQKELIIEIQKIDSSSPEFTKWKRDTEIAIERIFGASSRNVEDFKDVSYSPSVWVSGMPDSVFRNSYLSGLQQADAVLGSMIDEFLEYELENQPVGDSTNLLVLIERICVRFHAVARQLRSRHSDRHTISIEDEYDVQDLLHALLKLHFDDVRPEEWSPSYAGKASRLDFLLKEERTVIEVKKTRASLKEGKLGEELIIDRARYEQHPDCDTLVCFVYDPEGRIGNPIGLERDLENHSGNLSVRVIIAPRG